MYNKIMSTFFNGKWTEFSSVFIPKSYIKIFYNRSFTMNYHMHANIEIAYLVSGKMDITEKDGGIFSLVPNQFALIRKNKFHRLVAKSDDIELLVLELATPNENLPVDDYIVGNPEFSCYPSLKHIMSSENSVMIFSDTNNVRQTLTYLLNILDARKKGMENEFFEMDYEISIKQLFISLCKCRTKHLKISTNSYINHGMEYIGSHYAEDIEVEDIARFIGITPSYTQKLFRNATGMTVMKIVNYYRLKQTEYLLATTRLPISEIANLTGFRTENNLYKHFRAEHGCSPSDYKKLGIEKTSFYNFDPFDLAKTFPNIDKIKN